MHEPTEPMSFGKILHIRFGLVLLRIHFGNQITFILHEQARNRNIRSILRILLNHSFPLQSLINATLLSGGADNHTAYMRVNFYLELLGGTFSTLNWSALVRRCPRVGVGWACHLQLILVSWKNHNQSLDALFSRTSCGCTGRALKFSLLRVTLPRRILWWCLVTFSKEIIIFMFLDYYQNISQYLSVSAWRKAFLGELTASIGFRLYLEAW